ncbi:A24 family peptidase [Nitratifractor sp.]|uniref:prepilin peptidase n=1 Tax=Nitratifractor sp. TaxID=2268144 RepID=UPI0025F158ED|nr:A24 family peptidase [Nitratifractor sp.]
MAETLIWTLGVFLLGLIVGSFLNVVIHRTPRGENIAWPGSHCPKCGESLRWHHNVPLLSWLALGGRCAFCREPISKRYPLVELLNGLIWAALYLKLTPQFHHPIETAGILYFLLIAATFSALLALSMIDFEYLAVPDSVNFFALATALLAAAAHAWQTGEWALALQALKDAALAAGGLWLLAWFIGKATGKEAMGGADVIVAGTMAALLGLPGFFVALFISAILAILPSLLARDTMVPFVPFLAMGTLILYLLDQPIFHLVEHLIYG